jgi:hypothetical protein
VVSQTGLSDDPTEGFIGFKIHLHDAQEAGGDLPVIGYNGSGLFITAADLDPSDLATPTGFTLIVLPKHDLLAPSPRVDRTTIFRNIPIPTAGEWIVPTIDIDGSTQDGIVLSTEGIVQYAFGTYKRNDFSRTTLDPEDDKTFWTIQQIAVDTTHWATQITALHIEH